MVHRSFLAIGLVAVVPYVLATQNWSSPAHYPGKPTGAYSPEWQNYFEVTDPLENVTWPLPRNWAGSISTQTVGNANNTAFFWGFEKTNGSLTDGNSTQPWMIWLAGGPGYSSIASMLVENIGPIVVTKDSLGPNNNSWHNIADIFFVDNPVGTGYSTVGRGGFPADEDQIAADFLGFLHGLVKVFPALKTRPLHLVGESYAGRFIPYILKGYFGLAPEDRPVNFSGGKIGCSNPALSEANLFENIPIVRVIETYPQLIDYDTKMYDYLREQSHLCKFDLNLTYPQTGGKLPYTRIKKGLLPHRLPQPTRRRLTDEDDFMAELHGRWLALPEEHRRRSPEDRELARRAWMRETLGDDGEATDIGVDAKSASSSSKGKSTSTSTKSTTKTKTSSTAKATSTAIVPRNKFPGVPPFDLRPTGKINEFWGCDLRDTAMVYALNFTYPWNQLGLKFDFLDIPYTVNPISENMHPHHWMNRSSSRCPHLLLRGANVRHLIDNTTRAALHAPHNKIWRVTTTTYAWGNLANGTDPSPPSTFFLDELAANATKENVGMVWYSGNDDALTTHWSTEVVIQNTTFGGIQGFTAKPNTSWFDDEGLYAGVVRQERGWTYGLLYSAGHQTPVINPARSVAFIRDFFIGNSKVGAVDPDTGAITTQATPAGVEIPNILPDGVITGQAEVHYKTGTVTWPEATVVAWNAHVSSVLYAEATPTSTKSKTSTKTKTQSSVVASATASASTSSSAKASATATATRSVAATSSVP
ncbi:alpha/beta-hydrolase [Mycena metata]|uniref:Carboxypeptidase n=1 Tax=Mycena metata TaxID=1033252 RepID=A0AAD7MKD3_9AGAR|nr:alpha/beta-hydrolase [Mycena metata]